MNDHDPRSKRLKGGVLFGAIGILVALFGVVGISSSVAADTCTGEVKVDIGAAKESFRSRCGRPWNDQLRDQCTWLNNPKGWLCHHYAPNGVSGPSATSGSTGGSSRDSAQAAVRAVRPVLVEIGDRGRYNNVIWRTDSRLKGVNVYRNGRFVGSVNMPNNVYNDYAGNAGDSYTLVGYDHNNRFSSETTRMRAVSVVAGGSKTRWHPQVMELEWSRAAGARTYEVYRNASRIAVVRDTRFVDRSAGGNNTYTVRVIDAGGSRGPKSAPLAVPPQLMRRDGTVVRSGETRDFETRLGPNRSFRGSMTVDPSQGISFRGSVRDNRGNNLGSLRQYHDGRNLVVEVDARYGGDERLSGAGDPMELAPFTGTEFVGGLYDGKPPPRRTGGGGGSEGSTTGGGNDEPYGGHCDSDCQDERNAPR